MNKTETKRVDVFAEDHIDDGRVVDCFLRYAEKECDLRMDEERDEETLQNVLKSFYEWFVGSHPKLAKKINLN